MCLLQKFDNIIIPLNNRIKKSRMDELPETFLVRWASSKAVCNRLLFKQGTLLSRNGRGRFKGSFHCRNKLQQSSAWTDNAGVLRKRLSLSNACVRFCLMATCPHCAMGHDNLQPQYGPIAVGNLSQFWQGGSTAQKCRVPDLHYWLLLSVPWSRH